MEPARRYSWSSRTEGSLAAATTTNMDAITTAEAAHNDTILWDNGVSGENTLASSHVQEHLHGQVPMMTGDAIAAAGNVNPVNSSLQQLNGSCPDAPAPKRIRTGIPDDEHQPRAITPDETHRKHDAISRRSDRDYKRDLIINRSGVIIDMDGFAVPIPEGGHMFLCKELGVSYLYKDFNARYTFQVGDFYELTPRVRATVAWVMRHIHGMKFENRYGDLPQSSLPSLLGAIQASCITESAKHYIAYNEGHYERNVLRQVGIPYYDLESIGCPHYEQLLGYYNVIASPTCGLDCHILKSKTAHCPMAETMFFKKWLMEG